MLAKVGEADAGKAEAGKVDSSLFPLHLPQFFPRSHKTLDQSEKVKMVQREALSMLRHSTCRTHS